MENFVHIVHPALLKALSLCTQKSPDRGLDAVYIESIDDENVRMIATNSVVLLTLRTRTVGHKLDGPVMAAPLTKMPTQSEIRDGSGHRLTLLTERDARTFKGRNWAELFRAQSEDAVYGGPSYMAPEVLETVAKAAKALGGKILWQAAKGKATLFNIRDGYIDPTHEECLGMCMPLSIYEDGLAKPIPTNLADLFKQEAGQ